MFLLNAKNIDSAEVVYISLGSGPQSVHKPPSDFNQIMACCTWRVAGSSIEISHYPLLPNQEGSIQFNYPIDTELLRRQNCKLIGTRPLKVGHCSIRTPRFHLWFLKKPWWIITSRSNCHPSSSKEKVTIINNKKTTNTEQYCILLSSAELT